VKILCERERENVCECGCVCGIFFYPISVYLASVFLPLFQSHSIFLILKTHLLFSFPACLTRPLSASFKWDSALAAAVWSSGYFSDGAVDGLAITGFAGTGTGMGVRLGRDGRS